MIQVLIDADNIGRIFFNVCQRTKSNLREELLRSLCFLFEETINIHSSEKRKIIAVWDGGIPEEKRRLDPNYKTSRARMSQEDGQLWLKEMESLVKEVFPKINVFQYLIPEYEAEDVIGNLCKNNHFPHTYIISGDYDFFQLISEKISVVTLQGSKLITINNFKKETGFESPEVFFNVRCASGLGIGKEILKKIIKNYGNLNVIFQRDFDLKELGYTKRKLKFDKIQAMERMRLNKIILNLREPFPIPDLEAKEIPPEPEFQIPFGLNSDLKERIRKCFQWRTLQMTS